MIGSASAHSGKTNPANMTGTKPGTNTSFGSLKQIDAGELNVGFAEAGPIDGPAVILLHGWPYDIHSYIDAAPLLAPAGYRVIVPYLRGYGKIEKATLAGYMHRTVTGGIGHNLPQEAPQSFAEAVIDVGV